MPCRILNRGNIALFPLYLELTVTHINKSAQPPPLPWLGKIKHFLQYIQFINQT